jgi:hypothetical protein
MLVLAVCLISSTMVGDTTISVDGQGKSLENNERRSAGWQRRHTINLSSIAGYDSIRRNFYE